MKRILILLLVLTGSQAMSQNYQLFNGSSKKLYTDSVQAYSLAFDSVIFSGTDSVYFNFFTRRDTVIPSDSCAWWGNQECFTHDKPVWTGKKIVSNNLGAYQFFTISSDTIFLDFSISTGDTTLFYKDGTQQFFMVYEKMDSTTVLNNADSAQFYKIIHTDLSGAIINSALNGQYIIISKVFGLTQFFQVDSFPLVLKPLYLLGNQSPDAGLYQLTKEMVYDYQPGDEIQYHNYYSQPGGPPFASYDNYSKYVILTRTVTTDSMIYDVIRKNYNAFTYQTVTDTIVLEYYRHQVIAGIPFESYNGNQRRLYLESYCGINLWTYHLIAEPYLAYCLLENCWGGFDTGGPTPSLETNDIAGLGHDFQSDLINLPPIGFYSASQIVYFKKNGISCGNEILGINEIVNQQTISIIPNPFSQYTILKTDLPVYDATLTIYNVLGAPVRTINHIFNQQITLQRENLPSGMYFIRLDQAHRTIQTGKILVIDQ